MNSLIKKYLHYLKVEKNASPHTVLSYKTDLMQFSSYLVHQSSAPSSDVIDVNTVDRSSIRMWLGRLSADGLNRSTIARKVASLRSFFKFCFKRGYIDTNPAQLLIIPRQGKRLPHTADENSVQAMLNSIAPESAIERQNRAILELFYGSGIRLAELIQLNADDIDFTRKQLKVTGKGNKERIVPAGEQALMALREHLQTRLAILNDDTVPADSNAMFITARGLRIYPQAVRKMVKKYMSLHTECEQKSPHTLRHSYATHMLDHGADIRVIKELLGHSSLAATQVYTHTGIDRLKQVYDKAHPRGQTEEKQSQKKR
ncbi:MAG: tyrosine recombinase XerC [Rhodothermaceae bacterium]|nr:tyrosine recombinase XerC [Rhodothermaceae bacterium]